MGWIRLCNSTGVSAVAVEQKDRNARWPRSSLALPLASH